MVKARPTELKFYEEDGSLGLDATFDLKAPCFPGGEQLVVVYVHPTATKHVGKDILKLKTANLYMGVAYAMALQGLEDAIYNAIPDYDKVFVDDHYIDYADDAPRGALFFVDAFKELNFPDPKCLGQTSVPDVVEMRTKAEVVSEFLMTPPPEPMMDESPTPWSLVFDD